MFSIASTKGGNEAITCSTELKKQVLPRFWRPEPMEEGSGHRMQEGGKRGQGHKCNGNIATQQQARSERGGVVGAATWNQ